MFEDEKHDRIYNLLISNGTDKNNEYRQFSEKLFSKTDFLWKESISGTYSPLLESFYEKIDVIILLSGLYKDNKEKFDDLLEASERYNIPLVLVRPYGVEEIPANLEEKAISIVGWNANCIVDSIKNAYIENSSSSEI